MIWKASDQDPASEEGETPAGSRPDEVLDAAEKRAAEIREEAREWARRHMEEARRKADELVAERLQEISTLSDRLIARARSAAEQSDELISSLDDARLRLLSGETQEPKGPIAPTPEPETDHDREDDDGTSEGARLLATQMAVAGSSREEIASRLREEFSIEDPSAILDEIGL